MDSFSTRTARGIQWKNNRGMWYVVVVENVKEFVKSAEGIRENFLREAIRCNNRFFREGGRHIHVVGYRTSAV